MLRTQSQDGPKPRDAEKTQPSTRGVAGGNNGYGNVTQSGILRLPASRAPHRALVGNGKTQSILFKCVCEVTFCRPCKMQRNYYLSNKTTKTRWSGNWYVRQGDIVPHHIIYTNLFVYRLLSFFCSATFPSCCRRGLNMQSRARGFLWFQSESGTVDVPGFSRCT